MSKKQSLAAALQPLNQSPAERVAAPKPRAERQPRIARAAAPRPPSREGKKAITAWYDPGVLKQLKQIAIDGDTNLQELLREALNDFFQKHKKPSIA